MHSFLLLHYAADHWCGSRQLLPCQEHFQWYIRGWPGSRQLSSHISSSPQGAYIPSGPCGHRTGAALHCYCIGEEEDGTRPWASGMGPALPVPQQVRIVGPRHAGVLCCLRRRRRLGRRGITSTPIFCNTVSSNCTRKLWHSLNMQKLCLCLASAPMQGSAG